MRRVRGEEGRRERESSPPAETTKGVNAGSCRVAASPNPLEDEPREALGVKMVEQKKYTMVAISDAAAHSPPHKIYKVYPQRWFVLVTVCLLALSNATIWISYVPITGAANSFYCGNATSQEASQEGEKCDVIYWMSQIFQIVGVLTGILGMFVTDKYGIKLSCLFGSTLNCLGALIRLFSAFNWVPVANRKVVLFVGQTTAALAQSFFLCLSPKVAEYWFPEHQRALANALSFVANPLGVAVGTLVPTIIVGSDDSSLVLLNSLILGLAVIVFAMSICMRSSRPPTPPSASMDMSNSPDFFTGLVLLFRNKSFYIQMLTFGFAFALQWSVFVLGDAMFTELNYVGISGYIMTLSAVTGCVSSIAAGFVVDHTKKFNEVIKFCYIGGAVFAVIANIFLRHKKGSDFDLVVFVFLFSMIGFFWIPPFPIGLELGVETTFPVAEATSSGVLVTAGQLMLFLLTFLMNTAGELNWIYADKLIGEPRYFERNYPLAIDLWTLIAIFAAIFTFISLWPRYRRLEFEESTLLVKNGNGCDSLESR
ncbi:hypothetical protein QR680_005225 [Steinernema hermaphroditum]|uniref:Major facilitator superfamily (MFS) profile domain-containing protein n=1 Tax=Steinernema hermaphroditum TaxID=289476 RepID=A0AA39LV96_9BILA|nr:hypothetical protein QR680_005225 [Steinernema hermaphroditum]